MRGTNEVGLNQREFFVLRLISYNKVIQTTVPFLYPPKNENIFSFLMISGANEREYSPEMA